MYATFGPPWMRRGAHFRGGARCGGGWGPRGGRYPSREEWLSGLEEYQKDLEQEVADVADLIRRLREKEPDEQASDR